MSILRSLYPYGLAAANVAVGWLLYDVLNSNLGVLLVTVGAVILLTVVHDRLRTRSSSSQSVFPTK